MNPLFLMLRAAKHTVYFRVNIEHMILKLDLQVAQLMVQQKRISSIECRIDPSEILEKLKMKNILHWSVAKKKQISRIQKFSGKK